jgi:hypothetical protein
MTAFDRNAKTAKKLSMIGSDPTEPIMLLVFKPELRAAFYRLRGLSCA